MLYLCLRCHGRNPNRKGDLLAGRGHLPGRVDVSGRPDVVEGTERFADREAGTASGGANSGAVVSLVDGATQTTSVHENGRRTATVAGGALLGLPLPKDVPVQKITSDDGREFADHTAVANALDAGFPFAKQLASRERGLNGLVRQHLTKGKEFRQVSDGRARAA